VRHDRSIVQNASSLCCRFRYTILGPVHPLGLVLQPDNEDIFYCKQLVHPLPHEIPVSVSLANFPRGHVISSSYPRSPTHDPAIDTLRAEYLVAPCFVFALIFNYHFTPLEILWSFSIFLESVAILPQLFMLQRTGEAETITTHYLAALGAYRALYIPNWIYRCAAR
jgi:ER lumen protein retaining receptor